MHTDPSPPEASPPPPASRPRGLRRLLAGAAMFALVAGACAGAITTFLLTRDAAQGISLLVPSDAALYAAYEVHPSGAQSQALSRVLGAFPALATPALQAQVVDSLIDGTLKDTELSHADVLPWLGQEVGISLGAGASTASSTGQPVAAYVDTADEAQTTAALNTARSSDAGAGLTFTDQQYEGVAVTQVTPAGGSGPGGAYAIVDHVLVLAGSSAYLEEIIDTAQGRHAALASSAAYTALVAQLPADRLATAYADLPSVLSEVKTAMGGTASKLSPVLDQLTPLDGAAASVEAVPRGLEIDWVASFDGGRLTSAQRQALSVPPDRNATAADTPANAALFVGVSGFPAIAGALLGSLTQGLPAGAPLLLQGALAGLSGDAGIEVDTALGGGVGGALIVASSDASATGQLLDMGMPLLLGGKSGAAPAVSHTTYRGTEFSELQGSAATVAWTVTHGVAVIATGTGQMEAVLDTIDGGASLASTAGYATTADAQPADAVVYVNPGQILAATGTSLPASSALSPILAALGGIGSVSGTETSTATQVTGRILVEVP